MQFMRSLQKPRELALKYSTSGGLTRVKFENGIKKITMCDQKSRNSLSIAMMKDLLKHINDNINGGDLRIIVLSADGPVFSAGHNLKELTSDAGRDQHEKVFQLASQLMYSIIDCPVPIIAQVNGVAAAAGCQLVAQCDIAICSENSKFSTPGINFGIFCSTPGVALVRKVPRSTALKMLLTGLPISANDAKSSGLVTEVCPEDCLDSAVQAMCGAIMAHSRTVIKLGKRFFYQQVDMHIKDAYELGANTMVENLQMVDGKEGISSFVEKRKATWSHKGV